MLKFSSLLWNTETVNVYIRAQWSRRRRRGSPTYHSSLEFDLYLFYSIDIQDARSFIVTSVVLRFTHFWCKYFELEMVPLSKMTNIRYDAELSQVVGVTSRKKSSQDFQQHFDKKFPILWWLAQNQLLSQKLYDSRCQVSVFSVNCPGWTDWPPALLSIAVSCVSNGSVIQSATNSPILTCVPQISYPRYVPQPWHHTIQSHPNRL